MRLTAVIAATLLLASCGGHGAQAPADSTDDTYEAALRSLDSELDSMPSLPSKADSLSWYLGVVEGMTYRTQLSHIPESQRADVSERDYLLGIRSVLEADTSSVSYARGVSVGLETARFIATLESQGIRINRRLLAATIATMLDNPALDSLTRAHADSIAGSLINRRQKL